MQADEATPTMDGLAFDVFFANEYTKLVRLLFAMTSDLQEAEDLAQEAMSRAWAGWGEVSKTESPAGYTYRVALNLQRKRVRHLRVRARRLRLLGGSTPMEPHVPGELVSALAVLPPAQRAAVLLVEWAGMSAEEAGRALGVTAEGVRTRIHRAKRTLRESLEDADA
jgi:RNA polymerase sigma-70 factor, ECF subfamily